MSSSCRHRHQIPNPKQNDATVTVGTEVAVALITGGFAVIVAMIGKLSRDNRVDHGEVHNTLGRIEQKIDTHIEGHE